MILGHWLLARMRVALHGVGGFVLQPAVDVADRLAQVVLAKDQPILNTSVAILVTLKKHE